MSEDCAGTMVEVNDPPLCECGCGHYLFLRSDRFRPWHQRRASPEGRRAAIAEEVMGWVRFEHATDGPAWAAPEPSAPDKLGLYEATVADFRPDENIAQAWEVHQAIGRLTFSRRHAYLEALQEIISDRICGQDARGTSKCLMAWPDVLMFITPDDICRAALRVCR